MVEIDSVNRYCTVIVTVDAGPDVMSDLEAHAAGGLELFAAFAGFIGGALHRSTDGSRLVQYLQWESEAHHLACIDDERWNDFPSTQRFLDLVRTGRARMDVQTYRVVRAAPSDSTS